MSDSIYTDRKDYVGIWDEPVAESAFGYCVTVDCHSRLTNEQAKTDGKCYSCISADERKAAVSTEHPKESTRDVQT